MALLLYTSTPVLSGSYIGGIPREDTVDEDIQDQHDHDVIEGEP